LVDAPLPKNPYGSVKTTIYFDIINLVGNYLVLNELKIHMNNSHLKNFLNVHVKKIKIEIQK
jgi:hypothetical protein